MKRLEDLRFIIGLFFGLISIILLTTSQFVSIEATHAIDPRLNPLSGGMMGIFSIVMIGLSMTDTDSN
jgi:hypothetical protein